jgi:hypothetical protein
MAITTTWTIAQLERNTSDGGAAFMNMLKTSLEAPEAEVVN